MSEEQGKVEITAKMAMDLRGRTGAGIMDCKKALAENNGDIEAAIDWLRKKGLAKAATKGDRLANDGLIKIHKVDDRHGSMIMLHCETDFVAKTDDFVQLVDQLAAFALEADTLAGKHSCAETVEAFVEYDLKGKPVREHLLETVSRIGENVQLGAVAVELSDDPLDYLQDYLHGKRVGVLVCLSTGKAETLANPRFIEVAKDIAMQVAAGVPQVPVAVDRSGVDSSIIERESAVLLEQALTEGKPQEIAEKMVAGRLSKFYGEICLLEQPYVRDDKQTVTDYLKSAEQELGDTLKVVRFHRFQLGE